jgi:hypothetical protein
MIVAHHPTAFAVVMVTILCLTSILLEMQDRTMSPFCVIDAPASHIQTTAREIPIFGSKGDPVETRWRDGCFILHP